MPKQKQTLIPPDVSGEPFDAPKRRIQFTIKHVLLATALIAVGIWILSWPEKDDHRPVSFSSSIKMTMAAAFIGAGLGLPLQRVKQVSIGCGLVALIFALAFELSDLYDWHANSLVRINLSSLWKTIKNISDPKTLATLQGVGAAGKDDCRRLCGGRASQSVPWFFD